MGAGVYGATFGRRRRCRLRRRLHRLGGAFFFAAVGFAAVFFFGARFFMDAHRTARLGAWSTARSPFLDTRPAGHLQWSKVDSLMEGVMGFLDFVKKQFIDIIQWTEDGDEVLAWRFPMRDMEIQQGAQLTVRETQAALFVHQGKPADLFGPGQHTIKTQNLPLLTDLANWDKLFESPFKSDVYFFSTRLRLNQKWGTSNPITIRDREFGAVRLRAFGIYTFRIAAPRVFYQKVSGTPRHLRASATSRASCATRWWRC